MTLIGGRGISLALEDMPQMAPAIRTHNLDPLHAKGAIGMSGDGAGDGVEEGGPAAAGLELVLGGVEGCVAAGAGVDAFGGHVFVVFADKGGFGALLAEDAELL